MKTTEIKKILLPVDFSETARQAMMQGGYMAHLFNAKMYLFHSIEPNIFLVPSLTPVAGLPVAKTAYYSVKKALNDLAEVMEKKYEIEVETLIDNGRPGPAIAKAAKDHDVDIIVMGTHGANGVGEYFIGSNAHKVVTLSPCPVITITHSTQKMGFDNIVLPIDNSLYSRQKVNEAIALATKYNATVHILGLTDPDDEDKEKKVEIKLDSVEHAFKKANISFTRKLVKGINIAVEAMKYSKKVMGDLIMIMTDHESEITGMFLGVFAKQIINHSNIPVMSIRPIETKLNFESVG